jgi:hypothetical protein
MNTGKTGTTPKADEVKAKAHVVFAPKAISRDECPPYLWPITEKEKAAELLQLASIAFATHARSGDPEWELAHVRWLVRLAHGHAEDLHQIADDQRERLVAACANARDIAGAVEYRR